MNYKALNKYGLSREIGSPTKRAIRQGSGFGCVICGIGIYDYEHVDPEYSEAKIHEPKCMTLLCMQCHGKVTRGFWSKEKVKEAMKNPYCKRVGFSNESFDFGTISPVIIFAGTSLANCRIPIQIDGEPLFEIKAPEEEGAPFRFSGSFYDSLGSDSLRITDNEWQANADNWDVEIDGSLITIRETKGKIHLQLRAMPPIGIAVERLDMNFKGIKFMGNKERLSIDFNNGRKAEFSNGFIDGYPVGLSIGKPNGLAAGIAI